MSKRSNNKAQVIHDEVINHVEETVVAVVEKKSRKVVEKISMTAAQEEGYKELLTKSAKIRFLASHAFSRGSIAEHLGIRYQHVRNVLETPLKRVVEI